MNLKGVMRSTTHWLGKHSNAILTVTSATGVIGTVIFCIRDTRKATLVIDQLKAEKEEAGEELTKGEIFKTVAPIYAPTIVSGGLTIGMICLNGRTNAKRSALMASLYSGSQAALQEYSDKVAEKFGEKKEREVRDEIAEKHVHEHPLDGSEVVVGRGTCLCYDDWSDRYFMSDMETIKSTQNKVNHAIIAGDMWATLNDFYFELGMKPMKGGNKIGFNVDNLVELSFTTCMSDDGRPCLVMTHMHEPVPYRGW